MSAQQKAAVAELVQACRAMDGHASDPQMRFVYADGVYAWRHHLEVPAGAVDLTDLTDDAFGAFVLARGAE